jgi:ABC-type polysaccharide/polyol phosphate export permease
MNPQRDIADQVRDLLAYFPGRGRFALLWLIALPLLPALFFSHIESAPRTFAGQVPFAVFASTGASLLGLYISTVLVLLLRINHSERSSWQESATIIASSVAYGIIIGLPALLISVVWSASYVGISFLSVLETLLGILGAIGAVVLLATVLGALAHYIGILIPLLLFLCRTPYLYLLPVTYSITVVPQKWRILEAATPLSPAIAILRAGALNLHTSEVVPLFYWVAAAIHAFLGYALAFWLWRSISNPSPGVPTPRRAPWNVRRIQVWKRRRLGET